MKNQTKVLKILRDAKEPLNVVNISKKTGLSSISGKPGLEKRQIIHAIKDLKKRRLIKVLKGDFVKAERRKPPFRRTSYTWNKKNQERVDKVIAREE